jgi:hypothetical protein
LNDLIRKIIRTAEVCCGASAAVIGLVCTVDTIHGDQNRLIDRMWIVAAALVVIAASLEFLHQHLDDIDFEELESQLTAAHKEIGELVKKVADRHISDDDRRAWMAHLSKFKFQSYRVIQVGHLDYEAGVFAREIHETLLSCTWVGSCLCNVEDPQNVKIFSGVAIAIGHPDPGQKGWPHKNIEALAALLEMIRASKISEGGASYKQFLNIGEIAVFVGQRR